MITPKDIENSIFNLHNSIIKNAKVSECSRCEGSGKTTVSNGPDDFDEVPCEECANDPEPHE